MVVDLRWTSLSGKDVAQDAAGSEGHDVDADVEFQKHEDEFLQELQMKPLDLNIDFDLEGDIPDDLPLERLRPQCHSQSNPHVDDLESSDVESISSHSATSLDSESVSTDRERRATLDGEVNARGLVPPSDLEGRVCFMNKKSCKLHIVKTESLGVSTFFCGRKSGPNYIRLDEIPAFDGNGCIVCFNYTSEPLGDSDSS